MKDRPDPREPWPFSARASELAAISAWIFDSGPSSQSRSLVVGGDAGVGKTRLVRAALADAAGAEFSVETVVATKTTIDLPYAALGQLTPAVSAGDHPDVGSLLAATDTAIRAQATGRPVIVSVDDAHLLDLPSSSLLLHLALVGTVRVIATVRSGVPVPEPVTALWREGTGMRLDLEPMDVPAVGQTLTSVLGGEVADRTVTRLHVASGGNLLFLRELVLAAVQSGALRVADGAWRWTGQVTPTPRLVDVVADRLASLSVAEREALAVVAAAEPLPPEVAERLTDPSQLVRLEAEGLIEVSRGVGAACRLAHPLHGEAVLAQMGTFEYRALHRRLADAFDSNGQLSADDRFRVASWRLKGGGEATAAELTEAASLANQRWAIADAERLGRAALARGGGAAATIEVARALLARNAFDDAEQVLADAEPGILELDDPSAQQRYLRLRFVALFYGLSRPGAVAGLVDRFTAALPGSRALDVVAGLRAHLAVEAGLLEESVAVARPVVTDPEASPLARYLALAPTVEALTLAGQTLQSRRWGNELRALAETGDPDTVAAGPVADLVAIQRSFLDGQPGDLRPLLEGVHADLHTSADDATRGMVALSLGATHLLAGAPVSARRRLLDAVSALRHNDSGRMLPWALVLLARAEALMGAVDRARETRAEAVALAGTDVAARQAVDFDSADIMIEAAAGNLELARQRALHAADRHPELQVHRALLLHLAFRLGADPAPLLPTLDEIASGVESGLPALLRDHVAAGHDRDVDRLVAAADIFESSGMEILAAEALVQAISVAEAGNDQQVTRNGLAGLEDRARGLVVRLEGSQTPLLAALDVSGAVPEEPVVVTELLSEREAAVLKLVMAGEPNGSIATRLNISVRTVERHLSNVFAKTGTTNRAAAVAWCIRNGMD